MELVLVGLLWFLCLTYYDSIIMFALNFDLPCISFIQMMTQMDAAWQKLKLTTCVLLAMKYCFWDMLSIKWSTIRLRQCSQNS